MLLVYATTLVLAVFPGTLKLVKAFTVTEFRPGILNALVVVAPDLAFAGVVGATMMLLVSLLSRARHGSIVAWVLNTLTMIGLLGLVVLEHQTWVKTASLLDWGILTYTFRHYAELRVVIASETTVAGILLFTGGALLALSPVIADVALGQRLSLRAPKPRELAYCGAAIAVFSALGFVTPSQPELMPISRSAVVTLLSEAASGAQRSTAAAADRYTPSPDKSREHIDKQLESAHLAIVPNHAGPKNVLVFILESTRFDATSLYVPGLPTTPHLKRMAENGAVVDQVHVDMPHTSKAITSILCGYTPRWSVEVNEAEVGGLPSACAPHIFDKLGYRTAFFQSAWGTFESRRQFAENAGFRTFVARESLRESKFSEVNYLAVEDKAMTEPILRFAEKSKGKPFFAAVMTCGSHHSYGLPAGYHAQRFARYRRAGGTAPSPSEDFERYLNTVSYVDDFIGDVVRGLAQRDLLDDTLIVVVGDHGQGFLEHGEKHHNDVIHEEGLRVPLLFSNARAFPQGLNVPGMRRQVDILPTILDTVGVQYPAELFDGRNVLTNAPHDRIFSNCWYDDRCAAEFDGNIKVIDYFNSRPSQVFDLAKDPFEEVDLVAKSDSEEDRRKYKQLADEAHTRIVAERARIEQHYRNADSDDRSFILKSEPSPSHRVPARLGTYIELIGYDAASHTVTPGSAWEAMVYFRCLKPSEEGWRLFGRFETVDNRQQQIDYNPANGRFPLTQCKPGTIIADRLRMWVPEDFPPGALDFYWGSDLLPEKGTIRVGNDRLDARSVIPLERGVIVHDEGVRLAQLTVLPRYRDDLAVVLRAAVTNKAPAVRNRIGAHFGDGLVLEEVSVEPTTVRAFSPVKVTALWRVDAAMLGPWQIFTGIETKTRSAEFLHGPVDGLHPVRNWKAGTWVRDSYTIVMPKWLTSGTAELWTGFGYENKHMPLGDPGNAVSDSKRRVKLASIRIVQ